MANYKTKSKSRRKLLALPPSDGSETQIFQKFTLHEAYHRKIETAGNAYYDLIYRHLKKKTKSKSKEEQKEEVKEEFYDFSKGKKETVKTEMDELQEKLFGENLYEILGFA